MMVHDKLQIKVNSGEGQYTSKKMTYPETYDYEAMSNFLGGFWALAS